MAAGAWALLAIAGCGSDRPTFHQVSGRVELDGQPLPLATLTFQRVDGEKMQFARPSICLSDEQGNFSPWTMREGDGLPAGKYRVGVMAEQQVGGPALTSEMSDAEYARIKWKSLIPRRYNDVATSGLEVTVNSAGLAPSVLALKRE